MSREWSSSEHNGGTLIEINARRNPVFAVSWLLFTLLVTVFSLRVLLAFRQPVWIIFAIWAVVLLVFWILAIYGIIWTFTGRERLFITAEELIYERKSWKIDNQHQRLPSGSITAINVDRNATTDALRKRRIRLKTMQGLLRIGSDLDSTSAIQLADLLKLKLGLAKSH